MLRRMRRAAAVEQGSAAAVSLEQLCSTWWLSPRAARAAHCPPAPFCRPVLCRRTLALCSGGVTFTASFTLPDGTPLGGEMAPWTGSNAPTVHIVVRAACWRLWRSGLQVQPA